MTDTTRADALAQALCLLDTFAGEGLGHTYGNGQQLDADTTVATLCQAFGIEPDAGWYRDFAAALVPETNPAFVEWVKRYCEQQDPARMRFSLGELATAFNAGRETPPDAIADAGKPIGPEALAPFLAVAANIAARPDDYGKARLLASGGLANPADLYPAHFLDLAAAFRLSPMSHRCETCGVKDSHAEGCAENEPPDDEANDPGFLIDLASRLFAKATPSMGVDQGDTDRLIEIAGRLADRPTENERLRTDLRNVQRNTAEYREESRKEVQAIRDKTAPCVALVARIAGWSDDEAETAGGPQVRKIAQRAAEGVVDVFPHTYTEGQRGAAKFGLLKVIGGCSEDGLEKAVDAVADALGMRKAGA